MANYVFFKSYGMVFFLKLSNIVVNKNNLLLFNDLLNIFRSNKDHENCNFLDSRLIFLKSDKTMGPLYSFFIVCQL